MEDRANETEIALDVSTNFASDFHLAILYVDALTDLVQLEDKRISICC